MYKLLWPGLLIASMITNGALPVLAATHSEELTEIEKHQAGEMASGIQDRRFAETSDLNLV